MPKSAVPFCRGSASFCGDRATLDLADRLARPLPRAINQIANHGETDAGRSSDNQLQAANLSILGN